jgi:two-component system sensor kinase FixL
MYGFAKPCNFYDQACPLAKAKETRKRVEVTHYQEAGAGEFQEFIRIMYPLGTRGKEPKYFVEISRDVTEYRTLIRKLQASEKKFRAILDTATDAVLSIDQEHRIILFNNAAERIFGYPRAEALGRNLNQLIPPQYGDHYHFVRRFLDTRTPRVIGKTLSLTGLRKGGEEFPLELGLSHLEMDGKDTFTAIIRDVSEQIQLEKKLRQSERLAAVGQTVAHVAHEIKNPLMIIGGFSEQIRQGVADERALQKLDMILEEVGRLEKLVASLGDFTKQYKLMKRPANINSVLLDVLKIMEEVYHLANYDFVSNLRDEVEDINCDPDKLKQVFINLIANSMEAMPDGGRIEMSTEKVGGGVEIRIRDEGIGINEEDVDHIFEPFYTTREGGSGLGLSISYKIVEAHDGEIWAETRTGKGTSFIVWLPAE